VNWPSPNHHPRASALRGFGARQTSSTSAAVAKIVSGHQPTGWKPSALTTPARKANPRNFIPAPLCGAPRRRVNGALTAAPLPG
jgi:hypothetical protein